MPLKRMPALLVDALGPEELVKAMRDHNWFVFRHPEPETYTALSRTELKSLLGERSVRGLERVSGRMFRIVDPFRKLGSVPTKGELSSLFDQIETPRRRLVLELPTGAHHVAFETTLGGALNVSALIRADLGVVGAPVVAAPAVDPPGEPVPPARFLEARAARQVNRADDFLVRARIALTGAGEHTAIEHLDVPAEGLDVLLLLDAPSFSLKSERRSVVHVPRDKDSAWCLFELHPQDEGVHEVVLSAYHGAALLATLRLQVTVDATEPTAAASTSATPTSTRRRKVGEVTLVVRYDSDRKLYRYQWIDDTVTIPAERESGTLGRTPAELVEGLVAGLNEMARGVGYDAQNALWRLRGEGKTLWKQLIPATLADQISSRAIKGLTIISDADPLPWELLWPDDGDPRFLCERFPLMRWMRDRAPASRLGLDSPCLVVSAQQLQHAQPEIDDIGRVLRGAGVAPGQPIADLAGLGAALQAADFRVLHFACHNAYVAQSPASSTVIVGGQKFTPVFLSTLEGHLLSRRPLVFMNACRTAGQGLQYTAAAGWAHGFVAAGCGAFVGSLWEVRDQAARTFATTFYEALGKRRSLGEAMAEARGAIAADARDPTWLAYTVYGDAAAAI